MRIYVFTPETFQFTHPGKGATAMCTDILTGTFKFQFTHPGKGATCESFIYLAYERGFNSRTLGRVRLILTTCVVARLMFQFTHPGKGATAGSPAGW